MSENSLVLPKSAQELSNEIDPGYESIFSKKIFKVYFAGEKVVGFSTVCARLSQNLMKKYGDGTPPKDMQTDVALFNNLLGRQAAPLVMSERRELLREAVHQVKKIVHFAKFDFDVEIGEDIPAEEIKDPLVPPDSLGINLGMKQASNIVQPGASLLPPQIRPQIPQR